MSEANTSLNQLMAAQIRAEMELAHSNPQQRIDLLRRALAGLTTNGTDCGMCKMVVSIAAHALARDETNGVCKVAGCWCG